jgi:hypothetical protein
MAPTEALPYKPPTTRAQVASITAEPGEVPNQGVSASATRQDLSSVYDGVPGSSKTAKDIFAPPPPVGSSTTSNSQHNARESSFDAGDVEDDPQDQFFDPPNRPSQTYSSEDPLLSTFNYGTRPPTKSQLKQWRKEYKESLRQLDPQNRVSERSANSHNSHHDSRRSHIPLPTVEKDALPSAKSAKPKKKRRSNQKHTHKRPNRDDPSPSSSSSSSSSSDESSSDESDTNDDERYDSSSGESSSSSTARYRDRSRSRRAKHSKKHGYRPKQLPRKHWVKKGKPTFVFLGDPDTKPKYWARMVEEHISNNKDLPSEAERVTRVYETTKGDATALLWPLYSRKGFSSAHQMIKYAAKMMSNPTEKLQAKEDLRILIMDNSESVHDFHTRFITLALESGTKERRWKNLFARKLSPALRRQLANRLVDIKSFERLYKEAASIEHYIRTIDADVHARKAAASGVPKSAQAIPASNPQVKSGGDRATLPALNTQPRHVSLEVKPTAARQQTPLPAVLPRHFRKQTSTPQHTATPSQDACRRCHRFGHWAKDCPGENSVNALEDDEGPVYMSPGSDEDQDEEDVFNEHVGVNAIQQDAPRPAPRTDSSRKAGKGRA